MVFPIRHESAVPRFPHVSQLVVGLAPDPIGSDQSLFRKSQIGESQGAYQMVRPNPRAIDTRFAHVPVPAPAHYPHFGLDPEPIVVVVRPDLHHLVAETGTQVDQQTAGPIKKKTALQVVRVFFAVRILEPGLDRNAVRPQCPIQQAVVDFDRSDDFGVGTRCSRKVVRDRFVGWRTTRNAQTGHDENGSSRRPRMSVSSRRRLQRWL